MKKLLSILLLALCALLPALALAQDSTTIITTVPSSHTITIVCGEHGKALIDGKAYSGTLTVQADRLGTLVIQAQPNGGYGLWQIMASNLDGVTVKGRTVTLASIHCENTITITFCKLPAMPATENVLYDDFIGTGNGLGQLSIVFDGEYQPQNYEMLSVKPNCEEQKNTVLVRAYPDEDGDIAQRSLILSAIQLVKLAQKQQTERLIFENGEAAVTVDLVDLLGGNVQKLIGLIIKGEEAVSAETLSRDWSKVQAASLTAEELATVKAEIRILPVKLVNGDTAYDISVWLRWGGQQLDISSILPSLRVGLRADNESAGRYAVGYQAENSDDFLLLDSMLALIPEAMPQDRPDEAQKFIVTMPEDDGGAPMTVYAAHAPLLQERHNVVATDYAGKGSYLRLKAE